MKKTSKKKTRRDNYEPENTKKGKKRKQSKERNANGDGEKKGITFSRNRKSKRKKAVSTKKNPNPFFNTKFKQKKNRKRTSWTEHLFFILFIFFCLSLFYLYTSHRVSGKSMLPTFANGDRVIVNKKKSINRYDIITFFPKEDSQDTYIKRVIGMPGDQIYLQGTRMFLLSGETVMEKKDDKLLYSANVPENTIVIELAEETAQELLKNTTLPENQYLVLGDNRQNSKDSRSFGLIDSKQIEGVVTVRYYPLNKFGFVH